MNYEGLCRGAALGVAGACLIMGSTAFAADLGGYKEEAPALSPLATGQWEFGSRFWFSTGSSKHDIYSTDLSAHLSALTYSDLTGHSGEIFYRGDLTRNIFVKGYLGLGSITGGNLRDEDFPPVTIPYSSTTSDLKDETFQYLSADLGYTIYNSGDRSHSIKDGPSGPDFKLGVFAGYHHWNEEYHAYGCQQTATNPTICGGAGLSPSTLVISNQAAWNALRLGVTGDVALSNRLRLTAEAAYVVARLDGQDTHEMRLGDHIVNGVQYGRRAPSDESGEGDGVQLEAVLTYDITKMFSIGVGGRYWRTALIDGSMNHHPWPTGDNSIPMDFVSERYGLFLQSSLKFGGATEPLK